MLTWTIALEEFLAHKRVHSRPNTLRQYTNKLNVFTRWALQKEIPLTTFAPRHLDRYGAERLETVGANTWRQDVVVIKTFFTFLYQEFFAELKWRWSPLRQYRVPAAPQPYIRTFKTEELQRFFKSVRDLNDYRKHPPAVNRPRAEIRAVAARDTALFSLLVSTGCRLSEALGLDRADYDAKGLVIHIRESKGGRPRTVPIEVLAVHRVEEWLRLRPEVESDRLFITKYGTPMTLGGAEKQFRKYIDHAQLSTELTPHTLRHYAATVLCHEGSPRIAQAILGHRSFSTTERYCHHDWETIQRVHQEVEPLRRVDDSPTRSHNRTNVFKPTSDRSR